MKEEPLLDVAKLKCSRNNSPGQNGNGNERRSMFSWLSQRYGSTRKCVSSKGALLILLWSFVLGLWNALALSPDGYMKAFPSLYVVILIGFFFVAFVMCFFPLAGFLADIKYGRFKMVSRSLFLLLISMALALVITGVLGGCVVALPDDSSTAFIAVLVFIFILSVCGVLVFILSYIGVVGFTANVIQFGMDQLHDSPGEDRTLFIHWYVWTYYLSIFASQLGWVLVFNSFSASQLVLGSCILGLIPLVVIVVLVTTLCLTRCRRRWFLIEPGTVNPYKLVYRVTKFARQHKVPVNRSAFTYCEDEVPTGLDLAKDKYGGPCTTEQVEDIKAFFGILKVLFILGPAFFLDFAMESMLTVYSSHTSLDCAFDCDFHCTLTESVKKSVKLYLFSTGLFSPLLTIVFIPFYLCLLRPIVLRYFSMLMRIGSGIFLAILSVSTLLIMDISAHYEYGGHCMFRSDPDVDLNWCSQDPVFLIFPLTLSSLSHMLIYPAVFEFICSQSPHSMKGLLIGLLYTIKGLFQLLASVLVIPFALGHLDSLYPSCGFYYYLINIVFGVLGFVLFAWVSKRYQFRERDEPSNIHRYAEEYYSNTQQEPGFDYSYSEL